MRCQARFSAVPDKTASAVSKHRSARIRAGATANAIPSASEFAVSVEPRCPRPLSPMRDRGMDIALRPGCRNDSLPDMKCGAELHR
jgi:hypothetical protein